MLFTIKHDLFIVMMTSLIISCSDNNNNNKHKKTKQISETTTTTLPLNSNYISDFESYLISKNLINIASLDTSIRVSLMYSTSHNFLNKVIYKNLNSCYLPCDVAIKLCNAQYYLKQQYPYYNIIVFDAVRPLSIQKQMWEELNLPVSTKINYLAHPNDISLHNYGAAVDVGIIGTNNILLNMGTAFDSFEELSQPKKENYFLQNGKLSKDAYFNRLLLRKTMLKAGFSAITSEWWHFNSTNKTNAANRYELIN